MPGASVPDATMHWRGAGGVTACVLRASGRCSIFHEESADVTADELHGLPLRWAPPGNAWICAQRPHTGWSCAELPCGHTFHVSALALHFLSLDMRCPVCRRGPEGRMHVASLPRAVQGVFCARLEGMQSSDDSGSEGGLHGGAEGAAEAWDAWDGGARGTWASDAIPSASLVASAVFAFLQRQLRLAVEVHADDRTVAVFQTPLHLRHVVPVDLSGHATTAVFHECYVQRSFCRHVFARVASQGARHVSLRFSLTHPLFDAHVGSGAAHALAACDLSLVADPHAWDDDDARPWPGNIGSVRVDPGQGVLAVALQPHELMALWNHGTPRYRRDAALSRRRGESRRHRIEYSLRPVEHGPRAV